MIIGSSQDKYMLVLLLPSILVFWPEVLWYIVKILKILLSVAIYSFTLARYMGIWIGF